MKTIARTHIIWDYYVEILRYESKSHGVLNGAYAVVIADYSKDKYHRNTFIVSLKTIKGAVVRFSELTKVLESMKDPEAKIYHIDQLIELYRTR